MCVRAPSALLTEGGGDRRATGWRIILLLLLFACAAAAAVYHWLITTSVARACGHVRVTHETRERERETRGRFHEFGSGGGYFVVFVTTAVYDVGSVGNGFSCYALIRDLPKIPGDFILNYYFFFSTFT